MLPRFLKPINPTKALPNNQTAPGTGTAATLAWLAGIRLDRKVGLKVGVRESPWRTAHA
jgi:hypothetical protein